MLYWRVHWGDLPPFSAKNAWSRPWGDDGNPVRGYSAMESAEALVRYFNARSGIADDAPIVIFEGTQIGTGPDHEPLVLPSRVVAWFRGSDLDRGLLEYEDTPRFDAVVQRLGRRRRLK